MMKKLILTPLFLLLCLMGYAQKIHFTDTSNVWTMPYSTRSNSYYYSGDTVLTLPHRAPQTYHIIKANSAVYTTTESYLPCYIREDTVAKKVYVVLHVDGFHPVDTIERLLYNFNLNLNDTANLKNAWNEPYIITAIGIDSTLIRGSWHKVWHIKNDEYYPIINTVDYYVIEGIGCTRGFLNPINVANQWYDGAIHLGCFENKGSYPTLSPNVPYSDSLAYAGVYCCFDNKASCTLKTPNIELAGSVKIYPNPVSEQVVIEASNGLDESAISIYDIFGRQVYNAVLQKKLIINTSTLKPGVYVVQLTDMNGNRMNKTVVKE